MDLIGANNPSMSVPGHSVADHEVAQLVVVARTGALQAVDQR